MMFTGVIETVGGVRTELGECIRHDAQTDSLLWLDIPASRLWLMTPDGKTVAKSAGPEAAFVCKTTQGRLLSGGRDGFYIDGTYRCGREWLGVDEVINDGAVHPNGQLLVFGSRHRAEENPVGHMWLMGSKLVKCPWRFTVFNGPAFSPCGKHIYFTDSPSRVIYIAGIDTKNQLIGDRSIFATVPEALGFPDGMVCDNDGGLWSAHWDGGCITRYLPDGSIDRRIEVPAQRPTSLAFRKNRIYITSARDDDADQNSSADGCLFTLECDISGQSSPVFDESVLSSFTAIKVNSEQNHAT